jgi:RNA polymerase-binding transcription factor DksA
MTSSPARLCEACQQPIPEERLRSVPRAQYCVRCQSRSESDHDTKRYVDEGLAGSREDHKKMRGRQWGEIVQRSRGK